MKLNFLMFLLFVVTPLYAQTVADYQRQAVAKFPEIGREGSPLHTKFIELYTATKKSNPNALKDPKWPLTLADRANDSLRIQSAAAAQALPTPPKRLTFEEMDLIKKGIRSSQIKFRMSGYPWSMTYLLPKTDHDIGKAPPMINCTMEFPPTPPKPKPDPAGPASTQIALIKYKDTLASHARTMITLTEVGFEKAMSRTEWNQFRDALEKAQQWQDKSKAEQLPEGVKKNLAAISDWSLDFITPGKVNFENRPIEVDVMISVLNKMDQMEQEYLSAVGILKQQGDKQAEEKRKALELIDRQEADRKKKVNDALK